MKIHFATSNPGKFAEAKALFEKNDLELEHFNTELTEIQTDDIEELTLISVREAFEKLKKPVFVEDAGLFVEALNGFPGVYSSFVYKTIKPEGILKLLEKNENRAAHFQAVIAFKDGEKEKVFKGVCRGSIARETRGSGGFGYDPIFLAEGQNKTFAEDVATKADRSHRAQSVQSLIDYLKG